MNNRRIIVAAGLVAAALGLMPDAKAQRPHIITRNNQRIEVDTMRARPNGDIIATSGTVQREFPRVQILRAVGEKPAEYDQALAHIQAKRFSQAIPLLEKVAKDARWLDWDRLAMLQLGPAHLGNNDAPAALRAYAELFRLFPEAKEGDARWGLLEAMLANKDYDGLEKELAPIVASGSREEAARAQIMRGDVRAALGDREGAAIQYLRTVVFFKNVEEQMPHALFKAGLALKQMRDPRAKDQFQEVIQRYGNSPWAARARAEL